MQRFERKWFGSDSTTKDSEEEVVLDTMRETKANALPPQLREQYEKAKQAYLALYADRSRAIRT